MKAFWQGEKLMARRKELGLSMQELSEKVGCDRPLISMWERNRVSPSGHFLVLLCKAVNRTPEEFYRLEE